MWNEGIYGKIVDGDMIRVETAVVGFGFGEDVISGVGTTYNYRRHLDVDGGIAPGIVGAQPLYDGLDVERRGGGGACDVDIDTVEKGIVNHHFACADQRPNLETCADGADAGYGVGFADEDDVANGGAVERVYGHAAHAHLGTEEFRERVLCGTTHHILHSVDRQKHINCCRQQNCQQQQHRYHGAKYLPE